MQHVTWSIKYELIQDYNKHYIIVNELKKLPKKGSSCCYIVRIFHES